MIKNIILEYQNIYKVIFNRNQHFKMVKNVKVKIL